MAAAEGFTDEQMNTAGSHGRPLIPYRIAWARSYLKKAGLLDNVDRAVWAVTEVGRDTDAAGTLTLVKAASDRRRREVVDQGHAVSVMAVPDDGVDNVEQLTEYLDHWHKLVAEAVLQRVIEADPDYLERVIVDLLKAMGYAGSEGWASHIGGKSNGGVDGVVVEDQLGMRKLYCQAKRYTEKPVDPGDIRDFIGALDIKHRHEASSSPRPGSPPRRGRPPS